VIYSVAKIIVHGFATYVVQRTHDDGDQSERFPYTIFVEQETDVGREKVAHVYYQCELDVVIIVMRAGNCP
jgi:hypothetical protein